MVRFHQENNINAFDKFRHWEKYKCLLPPTDALIEYIYIFFNVTKFILPLPTTPRYVAVIGSSSL